jgi:hypothetical protein
MDDNTKLINKFLTLCKEMHEDIEKHPEISLERLNNNDIKGFIKLLESIKICKSRDEQ